ncbi:MAG: hypothetical protein QM731_03230 [Chitinophagaceae bacterium]
MSSKKGLSFPFVIIAIILGCTIYKQFDFVNGEFKKPALAIVYIVTFLVVVFLLIRRIIKNRRG